MTRICSQCQTANDDESEFCKNCGVNLIQVKTDSTAPKRRISKTLIISSAVFVIFFAWSFHDFIFLPKYNYLNIFSAIMASTFIGLIVSVPVFIVGFIIRKIIGKDDKKPQSEDVSPAAFETKTLSERKISDVKSQGSGDILSDSVDELVRLYTNNPDGFYSDSPSAEPVKEIGRKLNDAGGFDMMLQAHEMFSARANILGASRNLEMMWDGIGSWRG